MGDEKQWYWNEWDEWEDKTIQQYKYLIEKDLGVKYELWENEPKNNTVIFNAGTDDEMLKIAPDGFYVRGVKVEQGPDEAEAVYKAFKEFMTWAIISKPEGNQ